ncbi:MAG: hypothetical protein IH818_04515 [Acidobacteria bacterium]|nr:hypothetical protein [Acidobacteriota bacterium]
MSIRLRMEPWGRSHGGYSPSTFARGESALRVHLLPALGAEGSDRWTLVMSVASYRLVREKGTSMVWLGAVLGLRWREIASVA